MTGRPTKLILLKLHVLLHDRRSLGQKTSVCMLELPMYENYKVANLLMYENYVFGYGNTNRRGINEVNSLLYYIFTCSLCMYWLLWFWTILKWVIFSGSALFIQNRWSQFRVSEPSPWRGIRQIFVCFEVICCYAVTFLCIYDIFSEFMIEVIFVHVLLLWYTKLKTELRFICIESSYYYCWSHWLLECFEILCLFWTLLYIIMIMLTIL